MMNLRVLITTYHEAFLVRGGGEYEIFSVMDSLKRLGLVVDVYGPYSRNLDSYDVVLHFSVHGGGISLVNAVADAGIPIALWPNVWVREPYGPQIDLVNRYVDLARVVIFKSQTEEEHFRNHFSLPTEKIRRVQLGADRDYMRDAPEGLFKSLYGLDDYAIWFGVIEPNKNQLAAVRVLREKRIPLVLVGRSRDDQYHRMCLEEGGDDLLVIPALPQKSEIVRSALKEALFYIELSHEPPGLSAIEAGLAGCKLLLSRSAWAYEHFGDGAVYADPYDPGEISSAVDEVIMRKVDSSVMAARLERYCLPEAISPLVKILESVAR